MSIGLKAYSLQMAVELAEYELSDIHSSEDVITLARDILTFLSEGESPASLNVVPFAPKDMN
jgi:hypothetical protein